jgi:hypothetical protein
VDEVRDLLIGLLALTTAFGLAWVDLAVFAAFRNGRSGDEHRHQDRSQQNGQE